MSDELVALLHGCKDAPDDDAPRLVLADWLEEHGDPERAEFIRLQCRDDSWPEAGEDVRRTRLADLLHVCRKGWLGQIPRGADGPLFRRGFVQLTNDPSLVRFPRDLPPVDLAWIEGASFTAYTPSGTEPTVGDLANAPFWGELVELAVRGEIQSAQAGMMTRALTGEYVRPLLDRQDLGRLRKLTLSHHQLTRGGLQGLLMAPWANRLTQLHLEDGWIVGEAVVGSLTAAPALSGLSALQLIQHRLTDDDVAVLCRIPQLRRLRRLDLSRNPSITGAGITCLAGSILLQELRQLCLVGCGVGDAGIRALATTDGAANLRILELGSESGLHPITDRGAADLANSRPLTKLEVLRLNSPRITDAGAKAIGHSSTLGALRHLDLSGTAVDEDGAKAIVFSEHLPNLRTVDLRGAAVGRHRDWNFLRPDVARQRLQGPVVVTIG